MRKLVLMILFVLAANQAAHAGRVTQNFLGSLADGVDAAIQARMAQREEQRRYNRELARQTEERAVYAQNARSADAWVGEMRVMVSGAKIVGQDSDNTYLGKLANKYESESIFYKYGKYGDEYSSPSIWKKYGSFGCEHGIFSAFCEYASKPPMIIQAGKVIGYLTVNKNVDGGISPWLLKSIKDDL